MRRALLLAVPLIALSATVLLGQADHAGHAGHGYPPRFAPTAVVLPRNQNLPPSETQAKSALERSPRHGEFIDVKMVSGGPVKTWIVYPERKEKAGVVIVIHEVFGLSDWLRSVADQLAREGFIAIAPDLLSGHGPGGGGTDSVASRDDVVKLVHELTPDEVAARLNAVRQWAIQLPASNGKSATIGFCWGGTQSFAYAVAQPKLNGAVVYYGTSPDSALLARIHAPVLGFYGGDDERVVSTIAPAQAEMKRLAKFFEPHVYDGAGHGFLRAQGDRDGANLRAVEQAWPLTVSFLRKSVE